MADVGYFFGNDSPPLTMEDFLTSGAEGGANPPPSLEELTARGPVWGSEADCPPDRPPRRVPDNRRYRRDWRFGRSFFARTMRRGGSMPWHGDWPPVRRFDVVPLLRLRRERGAQSARWAAGVTIVSCAGVPEEEWTVTMEGAGHDQHGGCAYLGVLDPVRRGAARRRRAEAARAAIRSRHRLSIQPTHAP